MERVAVVAGFPPEQIDRVEALLAAGPPYDLTVSTLDRHAVYLTPREVVFVFEGRDVESELADLTDEFFRPGIRAALASWRQLVDEEPLVGQPVFLWHRGAEDESGGGGAQPAGTVRGAMTESFVEVAPEDTLAEAVERLSGESGRPALVVDYGRLIGVLGAAEVMHAVSERVHPSDGRVREWMSEPAATVSPGTSLVEAATRMIETSSHHLPVVEGERPVGVVDLHAVVGAGLRAGR